MAHPVHKRRKVDHTPSSDSDGEDEQASFASFTDDAGDSGEEEQQDVIETGADGRFGEDGEDSGDEDDEVEIEGSSESKGGAKASALNDAQLRKSQNGRQRKATVTAEELALSSGSFKSNVFKLQVDELLGQIRPRTGKLESAAEAALRAVKKTIEDLPSSGPLSLDQAERSLIKQKVAIPFPQPRPPKDAKYKFAFAKPANINVIGSFTLKTSPRSADGIEVDMIVTMPASLFEEKDFLNYRYFYKRAYYLAAIAAGIKAAHKQEYRCRFALFRGDALKPVVVISPPEPAGNAAEQAPAPKWRINIIPCVGQNQFAAEKLSLTKNCVRLSQTENSADGQSAPTAFYNSSLRADMLATAYLKLLHSAKKSSEAFTDVCLLGGTWLRQRGFGTSIDKGGFGHFEWATLIALCLNGGGPGGRPLLSAGYSSYQLFKATLQLLAVKDFSRQPLLFGQTTESLKAAGLGAVIWDAERQHNLLYKVPQWSYKLLRHEARNTLSALGDQNHDGFDVTFIQKACEPLFRYDFIAELPLDSLLSALPSQGERVVLEKLYEVLARGLNDRVTQISITRPSKNPWALGSSETAPKGNVTIGLIVNHATVRRVVDHGPTAEAKADAAAFREFWGEKAELRRFRDGAIMESLVWESPASGQSVIEQILRYLVARHFSAKSAAGLSCFGQSLEKLVAGGADQAVFKPFMDAFQRFENDIRGLEELPLSIREIVPADAQLRFASTVVGKSALRSPANVVLQFEGSARWPDDLVAIQRTKIAFLLKLRELLIENVDAVTCRIGLENEQHDVLNQAFLDVSYDTGVTFRLRIHHDREQTLFERQLKDKSTDPKSKEIAAIGLARYRRDYVKAPAHSQAVARLCTRYPAMSGAIRLAKKWFASHLLSHHIDEEVIELLVVRTFTQPWPWQMPSSVQTGFLRTLWWISRWDWRDDPLIVDLSGSNELKPPAVQAITTRFEAWRKLDPALNRVALFVATNLDMDGNTWTDGKPAAVVAGRMTALAKAACAEVSSKQLALDPAALFSSPLADFNFVLHLDKRICGGAKAKLGRDRQFKNLELAALDDTDTLGYDPAQDFLQELETTFGAAVVFFSGAGERAFVAGLWRPQTTARSWKVNLAYSTIPVVGADSEDAQAALNKPAMLAEMARLGGDLVTKVEVFQH